MQNVPEALLEAITRVTQALPEGAIAPLAKVIAETPTDAWPVLHTRATRVLSGPQYREQIGTFISAWQLYGPSVSPTTMAFALQAAASAAHAQRRTQTIELVWTGPASGQPLRRTAQVLQSVIDEARHEILIVSFAVYDIPDIGTALVRAAQRGVRICLVIESPQASAGKVAYDGLAAFGPQVAAAARVYHWPLDQRPQDDDGRHGSLHAKCAVADSHTLFISSANLTRYALSLNMELGILIRGGPQPREVQAHFTALMQRGVLTRVSSR